MSMKKGHWLDNPPGPGPIPPSPEVNIIGPILFGLAIFFLLWGLVG